MDFLVREVNLEYEIKTKKEKLLQASKSQLVNEEIINSFSSLKIGNNKKETQFKNDNITQIISLGTKSKI